MLSKIYLYLIAAIILIGSTFIFLSKNPINSLINLLVVFVGVTLILFIENVEYLNLMLIIIYVGAIAVLFLFVIMMLNIKLNETNEKFWFRFLPVSTLIGTVFLLTVLFSFYTSFFSNSILDLEPNLIGSAKTTQKSIGCLALPFIDKIAFNVISNIMDTQNPNYSIFVECFLIRIDLFYITILDQFNLINHILKNTFENLNIFIWLLQIESSTLIGSGTNSFFSTNFENFVETLNYFNESSFISNTSEFIRFYFNESLNTQPAYTYSASLAPNSFENFLTLTLRDYSNIHALGYTLYTWYSSYFIIAGLILLIAMIGAIVLTMHKTKSVSRKQQINEQVTRQFTSTINLQTRR